MKTQTIMVPKGKCPLDAIAELGERTRNAVILMHESTVYGMMYGTNPSASNVDVIVHLNFHDDKPTPYDPYLKFYWPKTEEYPEILLKCQWIVGSDMAFVFEIKADNIAFSKPSKKTEEVLIFIMEK